jgi:ubiquinone/menaquinone biosynthesis C-methylase UbiE
LIEKAETSIAARTVIVTFMESLLPRVLEPEVMDTEDEAVAYDRMDHSEVNDLLIARFLELGARGRVLDLGTGPAHIPILLTARTSEVEIDALDAAEHMLAIARRNVAAAGFGHRIRLVLADAKRLPFPDATFDAVLSNSIVHHIPDPVPLFAEIARVAKPGAAILLRDLRRPWDASELARIVAERAADADPRQRELFRDSLHAAFTPDEVAAMLARGGLSSLRVYTGSDRHWTAERAATPG